MDYRLVFACCAVAGWLALPAHAAQVNLWLAADAPPSHFPSPAVTGTIVNPSGANNGIWRSDTVTVVGSSFQIEARGYTTANSDGTGALIQRDVRQFGGLNGLGVCDDRSSSVDPCTSPNHSIDNSGRDNVLIVDFGVDGSGDDNVFAPVFFSIGWTASANCSSSGSPGHANCPDIEAWVGSGPLPASLADLTASAWTKILSASPDNNIQVSNSANPHYYPFTPGQGRYLVIIGEQVSGNDDYFKLQSIVIEQLPPAEVPAPGTLPLLALGSAFMMLFVRRLSRG